MIDNTVMNSVPGYPGMKRKLFWTFFWNFLLGIFWGILLDYFLDFLIAGDYFKDFTEIQLD